MSTRVHALTQDEAAYRAIFEASSDGLVINDTDTAVVLEANPAFCRMHGYDSMVGFYPTTFIHPNSHHLFEEYLSATRRGQEFRARAQDVRRDGTVFDVEVLGRSFIYQGHAALLGVVRDVTDQVRAYTTLEARVAERTREIERRRQVAEGLRELLAALNSTRTLDEILLEVLAQARHLLGCDACAIYVPSEAPGARLLRVAASIGLEPGYIALQPEVGIPVTGLAFSAARPVAVYDVAAALSVDADLRWHEALEDRTSHLRAACVSCDNTAVNGELGGQPFGGHRAVLATPLAAKDVTYGTLTLLYREPRDFSHEDVWLGTALANQTALAIQNAQVHAESERRRQELEALYHADEALHRSLRLEDVLNALVDQAMDLLHVDGVALWGPDSTRPGRNIPIVSRNLSPDYLAEAGRLDADPAVRAVWWVQPMLVANEIRQDSRFPASLRAALEREGYQSIMATGVSVGDRVFGNFSVGTRQPREFDASQQRLLVALANRAGVAIQNARLHEQSEHRRQELEALYQADKVLHRSLHVPDVLQALVDTAVSVLLADKSSVLIWNADRTLLVPGATHGFLPESVARMVHAPGTGVTAIVATTGAPVIVPDATRDTRVAHHITDPEGIRSLMHVPVRAANEVFGVFGVNYCVPHEFSADEQRLLEALADRAGLAIQNARLYEQAQHAATLEERQRLARELHDAVTQTLFSASLIADVTPRLWERDPDQGRQRLEEVRMLTRGALAEMRALLVELLPEALLELPLDHLLRQLADATRSRAAVVVDVRTSEIQPLPADVQIGLYRIAQESLNNVVKHAHATHVEMSLRMANHDLELVVRDNGRGFDPASKEAGHLGLGIMRERADAIGAQFEVSGVVGTGTSIQVRWSRSTHR